MRTLLLAALAACTAAPTPPDASPDAPYTAPDGVTTGRYDPLNDVDTFPDAAHLVPADTPSGWKVQLTDGGRASLAALLPDQLVVLPALEALDGFGRSGGLTLRFTDALDPDTLPGAVRLVQLTDRAEVPIDLDLGSDALDLTVQPRVPLAPATSYALVVDAGARDASGAPLAAATALGRALRGEAPDGRPHVATLWADALDTLDLTPDDIVHGSVFVTQSASWQDAAVLDVVASAPPTLTLTGPCVDQGETVRCPASLDAADVLGEDGVLDLDEVPTIQRRLAIPAAIWVPSAAFDTLDDGPPLPTVLHGHGLGGTLQEGDGHARRLAGLGFAVVATDAPRHGGHPTAESGDLAVILGFFGITLPDATLNVAHLRDNLRAAVWERAQLALAIRRGVDLGTDGLPDLDGDALHLSGHSLGALLGVGTLALVPEIRSGHLSVPGGRVGTIVHRSGTFAPIIDLLRPPDATEGDVDRFFPMLQAAIDPGEPVLYAAAAAQGRDLWTTIVEGDTIIPNASTEALARALGVPHVGEVLRPIPGLDPWPDPLPLSGHVGGHTRGLMQFDTMIRDGTPVPATHTHIWRSETENALATAWYGGLTGSGPVLDVPP